MLWWAVRYPIKIRQLMSNNTPFEVTFDVRFCETDALGHVGNTVLVQWFEAGRDPLFRLFTPELDLKNWPLILASYHVDFHQQLFFGQPVTVKTYVSRIGNSSFEVLQEAWQSEVKCATGTTTLVHFDFATQRSAVIPDTVKAMLGEHLKES